VDLILTIIAIVAGIIATGCLIWGIRENEGAGLAWGIVLILVSLLLCVFSFTATIEAGHVGVLKLFGKVYSEPLTEGLHLKNPFKNVKEISIKMNRWSLGGKSASLSTHPEGFDVITHANLVYKISARSAPYIHQNFYDDYHVTIISPAWRTACFKAVANYEPFDLISAENRPEINQVYSDYFYQCLDSILTDYDSLSIDDFTVSVLINAIDLPPAIVAGATDALAATERGRAVKNYNEEANEGLTDKILKLHEIDMQREAVKSGKATIVIGSNVPIVVGK